MTYKASLDTTSKVVTTLISALFIVIITVQVVLFVQSGNWTFLATSVLLLGIYVVSYLYRPVCYEVGNGNIIVHRPGSDVTIPYDDVKVISLIAGQQLKGSIRTFGAGGLFGYFGQFMNKELGCMTWYATKRGRKVVLIELQNNKKIVLTPDEPEQFVQQIPVAA